MSAVTRFQILRGTTAQRTAIVPLVSELVYDTDDGDIYVGDGVTAGGNPISTVTPEQIQDIVGAMFLDTSTIDFTYNDPGGTMTADLTNTTVTPGSYGSGSQIPSFTVDAQGRLTAAANNSVSLSASDITSGIFPIARGGTNSGAALSNNRIIISSAGAIVEASAITANRALASNASGIPVAATTTDTELNFVSGVTSSIQTQLNGKQPLDAGLTSLSALATTGILVQSVADTFITRTITGTASNISVTNGDGVAGNPTIDLISTAVTPGSYGSASAVGTFTVDSKGRLTAAANVSIAISASAITSGILPIARGGTNSGAALNNNRIIISSGGSIVEASAITAARALISDGSGIPTHSTVTSTELGYLSGSGVTNGGIVYGNGSAFRISAAGTSGQFLQSAGAASPIWVSGALFAPSNNTVATAETTTSTSYTDLATAGPAVTVTTGTSALVTITSKLANTNNGTSNFVGFAISGATTVAASDTQSLLWVVSGGSSGQVSAVYLVTGLTAGSNTFTAKYRVSANTGTFTNRSIIVTPT